MAAEDGRDVDNELGLAPFREPSPGGSDPLRRPYGQPVVIRNGAGRGALVLGLGALLLCIVPLVGLVVSAAAIALGVVGVRRARRLEATNRGQAQFGVLAGSVAGLVSVLVTILIVVFWPQVQDYYRCVHDTATTTSDQEACSQQFRDAVDARLR